MLAVYHAGVRLLCSRPTLLLLALLLGLPSRVSMAASEWRKVLDENGVKGYARSVPGSDILEFRSTLVIPARIELIAEILRDVQGLKRGSSRCREVRILEMRDRNHYTFYVAYDLPVPMDDRDVVIRVSTTYDLALGRAVCELAAVDSPLMPPRQGYRRIKDLRAQFVFEYLGREKTGIVYTSRTDPGGHIPDFLVNYSNKKSLRESAADLRKATADPKYRKAAATSPDRELVERILADPTKMDAIVRNRLAEFIHDRDFVALLAEEPVIKRALQTGDDRVGEILLHGWGSRDSRRQAVSVLLQQLLSRRGLDQPSIARLASDAPLLDQLLAGQGGGAARIKAALAGAR
jgi:hypothetical protein